MSAAVSLTPATVEGRAFRAGRLGLAFGPRFFILLAAGLMWAAPMLVDARFLYALIAWDLLTLAAWAIDLRLIPPPSALTIARAWRSP